MEARASMLNRDTWIGIAGALLLVAAMTGVFLYERGQFHEYDVSWEATQGGSLTETGTLAEGAEETFTLTIPADAGAVANVRAELTWTDSVGDPDTLALEIRGPAGISPVRDESQEGRLEVNVPVSEEPAASSATGRTAEDARDQVSASLASAQGQGTWEVIVRLVAAPGQTLPSGTEIQADGANDFEVTITYEVWDPIVENRIDE